MLRPVQNNTPLKTASGDTQKKYDIPLKQGALIKGTVIQKLKDGYFIIFSGGKNFKAHSAFPLTDGKNYDFVVLPSKGKIELKIIAGNIRINRNTAGLISPASVIGRRITQALSAVINFRSIKNFPKQVSGLITRLQNMLNCPVSAKNIQEILTWVSRNIRESGIFWETKVLQLLTGKTGQMPKDMADMDLKGILLKLLKSIEKHPDEKEGMKELSIKVKEALHLIEQEQLINLNAIREGLGWFVHLPFINNDDFLTSDLFIKEDNEGSLHFSMFLDMSFTGKMDIDVSIIRDTVGILIDVETENTKAAIMENIDELEEAFKEMGLNAGNIRCEVKENLVSSDSTEMDMESSVDLVI